MNGQRWRVKGLADRLGSSSGIYGRAAAVSFMFMLSAAFLLGCAERICRLRAAEPRTGQSFSPDVKAVEEAKRFALDRALYDDYVKSGALSVRGGAPEAASPVSFFVPGGDAAGGGRLPDYAPTVILKALAVLGGESVCVLDIDGEMPGSVFRAGDVFGAGAGRVVRISSDGVTWRWADREYVAGL